MRFPARGAALLLAFVVARLSLGPCACAEMGTPGDTSGGHCGAAGFGLRANVEACDCVCMTARGDVSAIPQVEPGSVRLISAVPATHALAPGSDPLVPPIPSRRIGHPPPGSPPPILRI
jgi:hypothetical protein